MKEAKLIIRVIKKGGRVLVCGNGGSASQADHLVGELVGKFEHDRKPLPAISLLNMNIVTAIANDYNYDKVFSRQIEALGQREDVLIPLTTSGKSRNILEAIYQARRQGIHVVNPPLIGKTTAKTQENQLKWIHDVCREVELAFI